VRARDEAGRRLRIGRRGNPERECAGRGEPDVDVRVGEPGGDAPAPGVEAFDVRAPGLRFDRGGIAESDDATVADEESARGRPFRIAGRDPCAGEEESRAHARATTGLTRAPTPSTSIVTTSPGSSGPTPAGVPVEITSPGSSVITFEM